MRLPRPAHHRPRIEITALIDVVFLLLIFVVLVARFVQDERVDVQVPTADAARPAEVDALMVVLQDGGEVVVGGEEVARDALGEVLARARQRQSRAVLVADGASRLQGAVDLIVAIKQAGFAEVAIATRPP